MAIFAAMSENVMTARPAAACGFIVRDEVGRWEVHARCAESRVALSRAPGEWVVRAMAGRLAEDVTDLLVASAGQRDDAATLITAGPLAISYDGTLDAAALERILVPSSVGAADTMRSPAAVILSRLLRYLSSEALTTDAALANVAFDLRRARALGSAAFVCSDGKTLYAYAMACTLRIASHADAIVIASPEALPSGGAVRELPDETLIACKREPRLRWSVILRGR